MQRVGKEEEEVCRLAKKDTTRFALQKGKEEKCLPRTKGARCKGKEKAVLRKRTI
jgi:hypothetical protein